MLSFEDIIISITGSNVWGDNDESSKLEENKVLSISFVPSM
jgi:hypothetical protein